jgi:hypothetical protein
MTDAEREEKINLLRTKAAQFLLMIRDVPIPPDASGDIKLRVVVVEAELAKDEPDLKALRVNVLALQVAIEKVILPRPSIH